MIRAIEWVGGRAGYLRLLDQTRLPHQVRYLIGRNYLQVYDAIRRLSVRGAPAIGVAAAYGFYLGVRAIISKNPPSFYRQLPSIKQKLISARPTAVNLAWALNRISSIVQEFKGSRVDRLKDKIFQQAKLIHKEDIITCKQIGKNGRRLIKNGMRILTYCNAGFLATAGSGTALAVLSEAKKQGKIFSVYVPETRPLLQGARLTAWELKQAKIPLTLICDNMIGKLMADGRIDIVLVGADRIARNGDTANKIGTYQIALLAHYHKIPFYIAAPLATFDRHLKDGRGIPIEYRSGQEITHIQGRPIAPKGVKADNPAFDITPGRLITGFITENLKY